MKLLSKIYAHIYRNMLIHNDNSRERIMRFFDKNIVLINKLKDKNIKKTLTNNAQFYNTHCGDRCFIFGNGPSLKKIDFSLFEKEFVITVNQLMKNPNFNKLKTNIHFWADPSFFKFDESDESRQLIDAMKFMIDANVPVFYPYLAKRQIEERKITKPEMTFFHYSLGSEDKNAKRFIDFANETPMFSTVVLNCVALAVYMGFKEIYLLGIDNTSIIQTYNAFLDNDIDGYAYEVDIKEKSRIKKLVESQSLEAYTESHLQTFKDYKIMKRYCDIRGVKLVNCTTKSLIDCLPKENIYDVLTRIKNEDSCSCSDEIK